MRTVFILAAALITSLSAGAVTAQGNPIKSEISAYVVKVVNSKESLIEIVDSVEPQNIVEYKFTYTNQGKANISGLTIVGPIPDGTIYIDRTANSDVDADVKFSIDGGISFLAAPVTVNRVNENGELVEVIVPAEKYTHIQWRPSVDIEKSGGVHRYRYRVRVK